MAFLQPAKRKFGSSLSKPATIPPIKKRKPNNIKGKEIMASDNILNAQIGVSPLDEPVDYRDLKAWIEEQEMNPKPLSPLQQRAISDLRRSLEPKLDDCDWVSLLNSNHSSQSVPSVTAHSLTPSQGSDKPTAVHSPPSPTKPPPTRDGATAATSSSTPTPRR